MTFLPCLALVVLSGASLVTGLLLSKNYIKETPLQPESVMFLGGTITRIAAGLTCVTLLGTGSFGVGAALALNLAGAATYLTAKNFHSNQ